MRRKKTTESNAPARRKPGRPRANNLAAPKSYVSKVFNVCISSENGKERLISVTSHGFYVDPISGMASFHNQFGRDPKDRDLVAIFPEFSYILVVGNHVDLPKDFGKVV